MKYPTIKHWRNLVSSNSLDAVLKSLRAWAEDVSAKNILNDILLLSASFENQKTELAKGAINQAEADLARNRLIEAITFTIEEIEEQYAEVIREHKKPIGRLDRVNCDRQEVRDHFWGTYRKYRNKAACQHYFILSERDQHPHSLVERLIFELESRNKEVEYKRQGKFNANIDTLPQGIDLEDAKLSIIEYFSDYFDVPVEQLADVFKQPLAFHKRDYIVLPFKVGASEADWKNYSKDILEWFIRDFCKFEEDIPVRFIFFFIIYLEEDVISSSAKDSGLINRFFGFFRGGSKDSKQEEIQKRLLELEHSLTTCSVLPKLQPVPISDLKDWIFSFTNNEETVKNIINGILDNLKEDQKKEVFDEKNQLLDMSFIESEILKIIEKYQEKIEYI